MNTSNHELHCGICNHKATVVWFFSLKSPKDQGYKLECPCCGSETRIHISEQGARKEWLSMFPTLFSLNNVEKVSQYEEL